VRVLVPLWWQIDTNMENAKKTDEHPEGPVDVDRALEGPRYMTYLEKLQMRTWLLHWVLFAYNGPQEKEAHNEERW
jgi:hypothetical protein